VNLCRLLSGLSCLLALLAGGSACRPVPEVGPGGLDLLEVLPFRTELQGKGPQPVKRKHWSLADGLPAKWVARPEEVRVEPDGRGLRFSADEPPWLETRLSIELLSYGKLLVEFGEGEGEAAELFYSFDDPPIFGLGRRVQSKPVSSHAPHKRQFVLPHPDGAEGRLRAFRLYPGGRKGGSVTVNQIALVPRRGRFLEETMLSRDRIDLNQEYRRCWRFSGGGERRVRFAVPQTGAVLRFGTGTLLGGGDSWLRLMAQAPGRPEEELLAVPIGPQGDGWTDHRVDLSPWAGLKPTLRFVVQSEEGSGAIRLIGSPVVRAVDGRKRPNVIRLVVDTLRADRLSA